jgi:DNA-binding winged helix-turn-helix (wHTH) protein/tetratricopeptide (TPR) repeat protein
MLKLADMAGRADLTAGPLHISPARRLIEGPAGKTNVEPIVMKVFLLLLDARGSVVTRDELFGNAWGGVFVGDDSLNRAIGHVRKIAAEIAPGLFEIETIPRTGYRLTGDIVGMLDDETDSTVERLVSRRLLVAGGTAAAAALGGAGLWWATRPAPDPRFAALMAQGDEAFHNGAAFEYSAIRSNNSPTMIDLYEKAVQLRPDSAKAWGLLGYFKSAAAEDALGKDSAKIVAGAQAAIRRALELDSKEPNARVGMYLLQGTMFDWAARDRQLRDILVTDPTNLPAMAELMPLVQAAGLTRESWTWNERILHASPFARVYLSVRALKLWILGRIRESDNVIDRVRGLWPDFPFAAYVRFILFALTGRPGAARAMLESVPIFGDAEIDKTWRIALEALELRTSSAIESARIACLKRARTTPFLANDMIMALCALELTDTAFDVTEGFLLWRGKIVSQNQTSGKDVDDYNRRMTQWLFTPPVAVMRADPRFKTLCDEFGLTAYWRSRNVRPDYQVYG